MDRQIRDLLGLVDGGKRLYRFAEDEFVQADEFHYAKIIDGIVFGDKGYVETLGPTWTMIHDPRFTAVEECFIIERQNLFGGDTRIGKQYVESKDGITLADSTIKDLEQYSEIIAEGRHFGEVLQKARSTKKQKIHPKDLYKASDSEVWGLIKQECPNYWTKPMPRKGFRSKGTSKPNQLAQTLFKAIRADMVGLLYDYSTVANVQEWVLLDTGDVVEAAQMADPETRRVWLEVDLIEKALSLRATLRCTAAKILNDPQFKGICFALNAEQYKMTDLEIDQLLRIIYESEWPNNKLDLALKVNNFLCNCPISNYEERLAHQLNMSKVEAAAHCQALKSGILQPITRYTDPEVEIPLTPEQQMLDEILHNPLKQSLYLLYTDAEREGWEQIVEILKPVFEGPGYKVDEQEFTLLMAQCELYIPAEQLVTTVEEEYQVNGGSVAIAPNLATSQGIRQMDAEIQKAMMEHESEDRKPN